MGKPVCADWFGDYRSLCFYASASVGAFLFFLGDHDMNNKYLKYLLNNNPNEVLSSFGVRLRRIINPFIRSYVAPLTSKNKYHIENKIVLNSDRPIIFAGTHGLKDDIALGLHASDLHTYVLFASLPDFFGTLDGPALWANGVILFNRKDKKSRNSAVPKMKKAIELGANILMFPEGTLNKTENLIVQKLFPGIYNLAKETNALIIGIAMIQEGKNVYAKLCEPIDVADFNLHDGLIIIRDTLATAKYELMEKYSHITRESIKDIKGYWKKFISDLESTMLPFYDYEIEYSSQYIDKNIIEHCDAFAHLKAINPTIKSAFLLNKRLK